MCCNGRRVFGRPRRLVRRHRLFVTVLCLFALVWPVAAGAFCRNTTCKGECVKDDQGCSTTGEKLFWRGSCIGFSINDQGTELLPMGVVRKAIMASFATWSDLKCPGGGNASLTFGELQDVSCSKNEFNSSGRNVNVVVFRNNGWDYKGLENTLAKATAHFDGKTGEIYDADIEINSAANVFTVSATKPKNDLQSVLTHEIGHFIGLGHSDDPNAVMYAYYQEGSTVGRALSDDDIAAVCAAYPPQRETSCGLMPLGGLQTCTAADGAAPTPAGCSAVASAHYPATLAVWFLALVALGSKRVRRSSFSKRGLVLLWACAALFAGCQTNKPASSSGNLTTQKCTPGQYVLCLCKNMEHGTKQCLEDGSGFDLCDNCPEPEDIQSRRQTDLGEDDVPTPKPDVAIDTGPDLGPVSLGPSNDACPGDTVNVSAGKDEVRDGDTTDAKHDFTGSGKCGVGKDSADVVYEVIATANGKITATLEPRNIFDAILYIRSGSCKDGKDLGCSETHGAGGSETLTWAATAGTKSYVIVDGYGPAAKGSFTITFHLDAEAAAPGCGNGKLDPGEACDDGNKDAGDGCSPTCTPDGNPAIAATCNGQLVHVWDNVVEVSATTNNFANTYKASCGGGSSRDAVYAVIAHKTGLLTAEIVNAAFDQVLYARAAPCTTGVELACVNDKKLLEPEKLTIAVKQDSASYIFVDGFKYGKGTFVIHFSIK